MSYYLCKNSGIHHALCPNPGEFCPKSAVKAAFEKKCGRKSSDEFEKEGAAHSQCPRPLKTPPVSHSLDSPLGDGAFGIMAKFQVQAQSLRARQRLPPRGSCQSRQALTEGVQPAESLQKTFPRRAALSQKAARQLPFSSTTPPVKMQCRSVCRRSGIALLKIIFPLNMARA